MPVNPFTEVLLQASPDPLAGPEVRAPRGPAGTIGRTGGGASSRDAGQNAPGPEAAISRLLLHARQHMQGHH
jgi:hypothetical protein